MWYDSLVLAAEEGASQRTRTRISNERTTATNTKVRTLKVLRGDKLHGPLALTGHKTMRCQEQTACGMADAILDVGGCEAVAAIH